ncbi:transglutaminase-like domain-containing protein [candidate division KSB1 bacterium]|nr:transglutaminase-like domain-containing protein [candidate division KSB1 bacterium]
MRSSKKFLIISLLILFIVLLIANIWHFLVRENEASFYPTSYATLYYPLDIPTIREWKRIDREQIQLKIAWTKKVDQWQIVTDGANIQISNGSDPIVTAFDDAGQLHSYTLTPLPPGTGTDVHLSIRFYSKEFYAERGLHHSDVYILRANVPCGKFKQYPINSWIDDYAYVGEEDLAKADRIIDAEIGIRDDEPTFSKMEKLARYLRIKLKDARGVPKDDFRWMNPWLIYQDMINGTGKGWCTQHGQIYAFFANRAGIQTRLMLGARTQDNIFVYSGHTWAESFIPEQNRWAFVDLSHGHIYIIDKKNQVLNTAELFHLNQHNAFDSTFARIYKDWEWTNLPIEAGIDSLVTAPYPLCNQVVRDEFTAFSILKFRRPPNVEDVRTIYMGFWKDATFLWGNLERYLFKPPLAYSFYPTDGKQTYFVRWALFSGLLFAFAGLLVAVIFKLISRKSKLVRSF